MYKLALNIASRWIWTEVRIRTAWAQYDNIPQFAQSLHLITAPCPHIRNPQDFPKSCAIWMKRYRAQISGIAWLGWALDPQREPGQLITALTSQTITEEIKKYAPRFAVSDTIKEYFQFRDREGIYASHHEIWEFSSKPKLF